jgi:MtrB/PioB family decaheme-associated outer membrane protein
MLKRAGLVKACLLGAVLNASALFAGSALAQQGCCEGGNATGANAWTEGNATSAQWPPNPPPAPVNFIALPVKAPPPAVEAGPYWWTHGEIEIGGRDFVNDPNKNGSLYGNVGTAHTGTPSGYTYFGQHSLAKYYEYAIGPPGAFGGGHVAAGSRDGLYQVDLWANNVASYFDGFTDQSYLLTASKAGEHYFWFSWDQSPHIYSTSAQTPYLGVGTSALTLPPGAASPTQSFAGLVPFLHQQDIGINRDTASAGYRWTPPDWSRPEGYAWDFNADYSHMDRTGTQVAGIVGLMPQKTTRTSSAAIQVAAPVDDTTQNFGANGEYGGISPWGEKFTFKVAYAGSLYDDHLSNYTVQNPFCSGTTCAVAGNAGTTGTAGTPAFDQSPFARISTWPSNESHGISATLAAGLPWQSRYVGTFDYTRMTQDDGFQPMSANPNANTGPFGPWNQVNFGFINGNLGQSISNLDGRINTFLSNNVLTTKITPELTQKLTYRYYDFDNDTPEIAFPCWISVDQAGPAGAINAANPCGAQAKGTTAEHAISSLTLKYIKQDAAYDLNWRPTPQWNFNGAFGYERYDYTRTDYSDTNEYSGKLSADWKPLNWVTVRASGYYAERRAGTHDYFDFVRDIQFPTIISSFGTPFPVSTSSWFYSPGYQQFMFDNREQTKVNLAVDVVVFRGVTITPTFKYQNDNYGINALNQEGINYNHQTSAGVDVGWVITPDLSVAVSYYWEYYNLNMYNNVSGNGTATPPFGATASGATQVVTFDQEHVNTVTAAVNYAAIPGKLNFDVRYALSMGVDQQTCPQCSPSYPNDTTLFQRLDASAIYRFDPVWVHQMGFAGDLKFKLRYTWERNAVNNWQNDSIAPFTPFLNGAGAIPTSSFLWLAYDNPNYNAQVIAGSLIASW